MTSPIKTFRITWQLSQKELAIMLGVSHSAISKAESGRQSLPAEAVRAFEQIQEYKGVNLTTLPGHPQMTLEHIKDVHWQNSDLYLKNHKKDREALLHKYEKQLRQLTNKYEKAMVDLELAERLIASTRANQPDSPFLSRYELDRLDALEALKRVSDQKPELIIIKIAGIKQELRSIKAMRGKKRQYPGLPENMKPVAAPVVNPEKPKEVDGTGLLTDADNPTDTRANASAHFLSKD